MVRVRRGAAVHLDHDWSRLFRRRQEAIARALSYFPRFLYFSWCRNCTLFLESPDAIKVKVNFKFDRSLSFHGTWKRQVSSSSSGSTSGYQRASGSHRPSEQKRPREPQYICTTGWALKKTYSSADYSDDPKTDEPKKVL